jgi:hypothetical protein
VKRLGLLISFVIALLAASSAFAYQTVTSCASVSTVATVLAQNGNRLGWAIWTTSGAATIYFRADGGTATVGGAASGPLVGGASYNERKGESSTHLVSAVAKSGTVWVCTSETY